MQESHKKLKNIPKFSSEKQEHDFWMKHNSADYIDWDKAALNPSLPNLKPSTKAVSIRLPEWLIASLKNLANKQDVPYQSLIKTFLTDRVKKEKFS